MTMTVLLERSSERSVTSVMEEDPPMIDERGGERVLLASS